MPNVNHTTLDVAEPPWAASQESVYFLDAMEWILEVINNDDRTKGYMSRMFRYWGESDIRPKEHHVKIIDNVLSRVLSAYQESKLDCQNDRPEHKDIDLEHMDCWGGRA